MDCQALPSMETASYSLVGPGHEMADWKTPGDPAISLAH